MATKKRKSTKRRTAARRKKAEQRLPAGLGTLFGGLLLIVLAFVRGDSVWRVLHDVLFGLFGCGSFVLGAAVCCLAVLYTRGEELLSRILKLVLGLIFVCGTVIVFSDIQPQGLSALQMLSACYANGVNAWLSGGAIGFVLGGVLLTALISVFVMTLSCALGWVVAKISLLKHKSFVTVVISLAFFGAYYFFYFRAMALIQELLANLAVYGAAVRDGAYPIYLFGSVGTGDAKACIIVTVFVAALFALMWALISRSFLKTATATGKTARTVYRETTVRQKSIPAALLGREFAHFGASPNYMLNCGLGTFLMPVCALLILWKGGEFLSTVETLLDGLEGSVPVMLSICLCGVASMNDMTAPSVSLEGKSLWLMQSLPVTPWQVLKAKLSMQIILTAVPMALCIVCAAAVYPFLPVQLLMMTLLVMSYVVLMALFGLFLGVKNPILTWTNEISPIKQSAPVMIALFGSFGYTILLFVGYVALPGWKLGFFGYMGCLAGLNLILCALLYLWLKKKGSARFSEL